jgi:putative peptide zinc metalloprotease protein
VPYVDASAASAFPSRRRRIVVSAAGMMAELVLAALALAVWSAAEPGLVRAIAFNTLVIAGVSTLFFNGNPLLRFDAYYILMDLIGVQNLGSRAPRWWGWLLHRFGFGLKRWPNPARDRYEAVWFALYQPLSYAYRLWLTFSIALFVASSYFALGVALAAWSVALTILLPLGRGLWHVATGAGVAPRRGRALGVVAVLAALLVAGLTLTPVPHGTVVQGVVRAPEAGAITTATDGTLDASARLSTGAVEAGQPVLTVQDPLAAAELRVLAARVRVAAARLRAAEARAADERSGAGIAVAQAAYRYREAEHRDREAEEAARRVDAPIDGVFVATPDRLAAGRPVRRGEIIGHVLDPRTTRVQVAIPVSAIDLVRRSPERVAVRFADRPRQRHTGHVTAMAPEPTHQLPAPALAQQAGGPFALDPADPEGRASLTALVLSEVVVVSPDPPPPLGARVYVRFDHGAPPLWQRLARGLRQLFLAELGV